MGRSGRGRVQLFVAHFPKLGAERLFRRNQGALVPGDTGDFQVVGATVSTGSPDRGFIESVLRFLCWAGGLVLCCLMTTQRPATDLLL